MVVQSHSPTSTPAAPKLPAGTERISGEQDQWLIPAGCSVQAIRRMIVLIPHQQLDERILIRKTLKIASLHNAQIMFFALGRTGRLGWYAATARLLRVICCGI
jgi:hypothetical protein